MTIMSSTTPLVLFSWQAPNLLRRYADTTAWRVQCFGVLPGWEPEPWDGVTAPHAVVVHSPDAYALARKTWPTTRLVWMFHAGHEELFTIIKDWVPEILVCSRRVGRICQAHFPQARVHVLAPWYEPKPIWRWKRHYVFSMLNDPLTRRQERAVMTERVVRDAFAALLCLGRRPISEGFLWERFGRGQPLGHLDGERRRELEQHCSAYVDVLPHFAGFGLAHHEMFAAGVPVVSTRWGDTSEEVRADYYTLHDDLDELTLRLEDVLVSSKYAAKSSVAGLDYISTARRRERMDEQINKFLEG